jgi:hypothetical protein
MTVHFCPDANVLNLAQSEVNIQYKYADFRPLSVIIVTWENMVATPSKTVHTNIYYPHRDTSF